MSLMGMRRVMQRHGTPIWIMLAGAMVVTSLVGFGSYWWGDEEAGRAQNGTNEAPIALVGDLKVRRSELDQTLNQFSVGQSPLVRASTSLMVLEQYKRQQAAVAAAKQAGITVTDADIQKERDERWKTDREGLIQGLGLKPGATDAEIARSLPSDAAPLEQLKQRYPEEELRTGAYVRKLQEKFEQAARTEATERTVRNSYADIKVRHILIKFGAGALPEEQARAKAQKILDAIKADPSKMPALADANTEDPGNLGTGGKKQGGFYDWRPANTYVPAFAAAAQSMQPGQVYPELVRVVNPNYSGFHIVKLEGTRPGAGLPKDFDKDKQKYIDQYVQQTAQQKLMEAMTAALPAIKVEIKDPVLRAAQMQQESGEIADKATRETRLRAALDTLKNVGAEDNPAAPFLRADLHETLGNTKEAIAAHKEALAYSDTLETRLALANLYLRDNNKTEAVNQLKEAESLVRDEVSTQQQIATLYKQAGRADLAATAEKKYQEMARREQEQNQAAPVVKPGPGG